MMDVEGQVAYWRESAGEDLLAAASLLATGRHPRHALFFVHLALEKALKAIVCRVTEAPPPRIHSLVHLAEMARIPLEVGQLDFLAEMNAFQIEGRYPELAVEPVSVEEAAGFLHRADEVLQWLLKA